MIRKYFFAVASLLFLIGTVFAMGDTPKQGKPVSADIAAAAPGDRVIAYYFHGDFRCHTCRTMEQYSKEAIDANFKDALSSGKLEFKEVNVEERGNEHFAQDYQLYTRSLVLSLVKDGKEIRSKNLTRIWDYARDKKMFFDYVSEEIKDFLKEV